MTWTEWGICMWTFGAVLFATMKAGAPWALAGEE